MLQLVARALRRERFCESSDHLAILKPDRAGGFSVEIIEWRTLQSGVLGDDWLLAILDERDARACIHDCKDLSVIASLPGIENYVHLLLSRAHPIIAGILDEPWRCYMNQPPFAPIEIAFEGIRAERTLGFGALNERSFLTFGGTPTRLDLWTRVQG